MLIQKHKYLLLLILIFIIACSEDPVACFETDIENPEAHQNIKFQNCSSDSDTYEWNFGDGVISTDANPVHAYSDTGIFEIQLNSISDFGGSNNLLIKEIKIANPSEKFTGNYQAQINQDNYLLQIKSGNTTSSLLFYIDGQMFCNAECRLQNIIVNQQHFWDNNFNLIINGVGALSDNNIEIEFLVEDYENNQHLIILTADRINL